ncbi:MFP1 attachment factor 1 [Platanthera guangdongensis]|uniref:MFP1 attachment factor 1 n=1 Tax=Platanthera guangdongensis TaxID=2320717 RepID=A0ABR2LE62_9ASPA
MAEDSEEIKHEGEVENPKSEDAPAPAPTPVHAADGGRPTSPASSYTNFSVNIWPPSQRTRDAVINRLIENLSTPSVLSKRYGTLPPEESSAIARQIEEEAFAVAAASASPPSADAGDEVGSVEEGIQILHIYSKEISRRMIDSVKVKAYSAYSAPAENNAAPAPENHGEVAESVPTPAAITGGEEIASEEVQPPSA